MTHGRRPRGAWLVATSASIRDVFRSLFRQRLRSVSPMLLVLIVLGLLLGFLTAISPLAPFVYPLF